MSTAPDITRKIIHVDMDAFYASVEQRDDPSLKGKPVVVGGTPDRRGVVCAASYEARQFGVFSAMPAKTALRKCPHLIILHPRFDVYKAISHQIREIFHQYTDLVEPLALDEAYLDVTNNKFGNPSATLVAKEIKAEILKQTNLTASAGVSVNKFLAKTASGMRKPNGLYLIKPETAQSFVEQLPIDKFYGIGDVTAEKMRRLGINSGADLKQWTEGDLIKNFGRVGSYYYLIARGQDDRPVVANRIPKSIGAEESFPEDLREIGEFMQALGEIAETLDRRMKASRAYGRTLTLKVKYGDYQQVTRSRTFAAPVRDIEKILVVARQLLATTEVESKQARLLGLSLSNLDCEDDDSDADGLVLDGADSLPADSQRTNGSGNDGNSSHHGDLRNLKYVQLTINFD